MTALDRAFVKAYLPQRHLVRRPAARAESTATASVMADTPATISRPAEPARQAHIHIPVSPAPFELEPLPAIEPPVDHEPAFTLQIATEAEEPVLAEIVSEEIPAAPIESETSPVQPLSSFTITNVAEEEFRPRLEVDRFSWPEAVARLSERSEREIQAFVDQLAARAYQGERLFGLIGMHRQVGCTTSLLAIARQLSKRRLRTVVVDAKFTGPHLAPRLGVAAPAGWEQIYAGAMPLEEIVISSVEDGLSLVALDPSASIGDVSLGALHVSVMFGMLRDHYDVILLDAGTMDELSELSQIISCGAAAQPDGVYLVYDRRSAADATVAQACRRLASLRLEVLGSVENFVSREGQSPQLSIVG